MTREEFQAAAGAVIDDAVMADDTRADPGWLDTIMRAHDAAISETWRAGYGAGRDDEAGNLPLRAGAS